MFVVEQLDEPGGILVVVDDLGIHSNELYQAKAGCLFHLVSCMPNRERRAEDTLNNKQNSNSAGCQQVWHAVLLDACRNSLWLKGPQSKINNNT